MAFMLEMIFLGYLIVRKYGGPGSEKLSAAMGIFGGGDGAVHLQVGRIGGGRFIRKRAS